MLFLPFGLTDPPYTQVSETQPPTRRKADAGWGQNVGGDAKHEVVRQPPSSVGPPSVVTVLHHSAVDAWSRRSPTDHLYQVTMPPPSSQSPLLRRSIPFLLAGPILLTAAFLS